MRSRCSSDSESHPHFTSSSMDCMHSASATPLFLFDPEVTFLPWSRWNLSSAAAYVTYHIFKSKLSISSMTAVMVPHTGPSSRIEL